MEGKNKNSLESIISMMVAIIFCASSIANAAPVVTDIRVGIQHDVTSILFEFTEDTNAKVFVLGDPYRVVIDLPEVGWRLPPRPLPKSKGVYENLRYGLYKPGNSRVVLDLNKPAKIQNVSILVPDGIYSYRLAIDLVPTTGSDFLVSKNSGPITVSSKLDSQKLNHVLKSSPRRKVSPAIILNLPPSKPKRVSGKSLPRSLTKYPIAPRKPKFKDGRSRHTIVIDPGHGGVDPGAVGGSGSYEKHIALSMSRAIRKELQVYDIYNVSLTRDRDIFVPLRERISIARDRGADLFLSVHADAINNRRIRGPSVYTLSERASDKEAAALAEKENKVDLIAGIDLSNNSEEVANILIDLAQRVAMNESARFANLLVNHLRRRTKVLRNTHRFAGFAVLKAPDVPSVLLELGFLSNIRDERALQSPPYRKKIARGVAEAINSFFQGADQAARR